MVIDSKLEIIENALETIEQSYITITVESLREVRDVGRTPRQTKSVVLPSHPRGVESPRAAFLQCCLPLRFGKLSDCICRRLAAGDEPGAGNRFGLGINQEGMRRPAVHITMR